MNPGIITSFVIGGLMLLSVLAYNMNLSQSTQETTLSTINQYKIDNLVEILSNDFHHIGFNLSDSVSTLEEPVQPSSNSKKLVYKYNNSGETITWMADPDEPYTNSSNEDDYYLYRIKDGETTAWFPVTYFNVEYYLYNNLTKSWEVTANRKKATRFEVEIMMESQEPIRSTKSGSNTYHRTAWKKTFTPNNINKPW